MHGIRHHHKDGRFWFDLSEVPTPTFVMSAELRLYINQSMSKEDSINNTESDSKLNDTLSENNQDESMQQFSITLYEIGKEGTLRFVDRLELDSEQEGWVAFNVSLVLKHWLMNPEENFGLQLICRSSTGKQSYIFSFAVK